MAIILDNCWDCQGMWISIHFLDADFIDPQAYVRIWCTSTHCVIRAVEGSRSLVRPVESTVELGCTLEMIQSQVTILEKQMGNGKYPLLGSGECRNKYEKRYCNFGIAGIAQTWQINLGEARWAESICNGYRPRNVCWIHLNIDNRLWSNNMPVDDKTI